MPADLPPPLRDRILAHRAAWADAPRPPHIVRPGPGQESVWDYPRPPRVEPVGKPVRVVFAGHTVAATDRALRVLETAGAPTIYIPPGDVDMGCLVATGGGGMCEWKGVFRYVDLVVGGRRSAQAGWSFPDPFTDLAEGYGQIAGWLSFYPGRTDGCFIGAEKVSPQPGGYYGGWVTANLTGPIKGEPGSGGW